MLSEMSESFKDVDVIHKFLLMKTQKSTSTRANNIMAQSKNRLLGHFMTPGLGKSIPWHVRPHSFLHLQITRADIKWQGWAVNLVIAHGHLELLQRGLCRHGYVWVKILTLSPSHPHHPQTIAKYLWVTSQMEEQLATWDRASIH